MGKSATVLDYIAEQFENDDLFRTEILTPGVNLAMMRKEAL